MADERNPVIDKVPRNYTAKQDFEGITVIDPAGNEQTGTLGGKTDEEIRDLVAAFLTGGTEMTVTHNDAGDTLTLDFSGTHYTDSDAEAAINNDADHGSTASHDYLQTTDVTSANWGDYEIQVDGTDGAGIINFKTS